MFALEALLAAAPEPFAVLELLDDTFSVQRKPESVLSALEPLVEKAVTLKGVRGEADETAALLLKRMEC